MNVLGQMSLISARQIRSVIDSRWDQDICIMTPWRILSTIHQGAAYKQLHPAWPQRHASPSDYPRRLTVMTSSRDLPFAAPIRNPRTRRSFLKVAGASLLTTSALHAQWIASGTTQHLLLNDLPALDGDLLLDEAHRQTAATDWGFQLSRVPLGVLRPKSVDDVVRMVAYAN